MQESNSQSSTPPRKLNQLTVKTSKNETDGSKSTNQKKNASPVHPRMLEGARSTTRTPISSTNRSPNRSPISINNIKIVAKHLLSDSTNNPVATLTRAFRRPSDSKKFENSQSTNTEAIATSTGRTSPRKRVTSIKSKSGAEKSSDDFIAADWTDYIVDVEERRYSHTTPEKNKRIFPTTWILVCGQLSVMITMVVMYGFQSPATNPLLGPTSETLVRFGGNVPVYVRQDPQQHIWRIFTASFLHGGFVHWFVNSMAQLIIFPKADRWYGFPRMIAIHIVTMVGGNVISSVMRYSEVVSIGASGDICGILAAILVETLLNWRVINKPVGQLFYWGFMLIGVLLLGLIPFVDNFMHVGGTICGIGAGLLFCPLLAKQMIWTRILVRLLGLAVVGVLVGGGVYVLFSHIQLASNNPSICLLFLSLSC